MKYNKKEDTYQCAYAFKFKQGTLITEKKTTYEVLSCVDMKWLNGKGKKYYTLTLRKLNKKGNNS